MSIYCISKAQAIFQTQHKIVSISIFAKKKNETLVNTDSIFLYLNICQLTYPGYRLTGKTDDKYKYRCGSLSDVGFSLSLSLDTYVYMYLHFKYVFFKYVFFLNMYSKQSFILKTKKALFLPVKSFLQQLFANLEVKKKTEIIHNHLQMELFLLRNNGSDTFYLTNQKNKNILYNAIKQ